MLGIAYKRDDDMREVSRGYDGAQRAEGANVDYSDPHVPVFPDMRNHSFDLKSVDLNKDHSRHMTQFFRYGSLFI